MHEKIPPSTNKESGMKIEYQDSVASGGSVSFI